MGCLLRVSFDWLLGLDRSRHPWYRCGCSAGWRGIPTSLHEDSHHQKPMEWMVRTMTVTQPMSRVRYTENEVNRLRTDVAEWKEEHDALTGDCWVWEDLVVKANHVYARIMKLDEDFRECVLVQGVTYDPELNSAIQKLVKDWHETAAQILLQVDRLERKYKSFEGSAEFRRNFAEVKDILTPDHIFFGGDQLTDLRDRAIEANRYGHTEILHGGKFS